MENKTLDQSVQDAIQKSLSEGIIEKVITQKLEKCIGDAVDDMFKWSGPVKKVIEEKITESMVEEIEKYNFSNYTAKLEPVLEKLLKESTLENKKVIENFEKIVITTPDKIEVSEIFTQYCEVAEKIDSYYLPDYSEHEGAEVTCYMEYVIEEGMYGFREDKYLIFGTRDSDGKIIEDMTYKVKLWVSSDGTFRVDEIENGIDFFSLSTLDEFTIFLLKYKRKHTRIELNEDNMEDEVHIDGEYECNY